MLSNLGVVYMNLDCVSISQIHVTILMCSTMWFDDFSSYALKYIHFFTAGQNIKNICAEYNADSIPLIRQKYFSRTVMVLKILILAIVNVYFYLIRDDIYSGLSLRFGIKKTNIIQSPVVEQKE